MFRKKPVVPAPVAPPLTALEEAKKKIDEMLREANERVDRMIERLTDRDARQP